VFAPPETFEKKALAMMPPLTRAGAVVKKDVGRIGVGPAQAGALNRTLPPRCQAGEGQVGGGTSSRWSSCQG